MAKNDNPMEQMMDIWKEGQDAFLKAQKDVVNSFQNSLTPPSLTGYSGMSGFDGNGPADKFGFGSNGGAETMAAWQNFIKSWAPDWDPTAMMASGKKPGMFNQGSEAFAAMLDPANWTQYAPDQLRSILESIAQGPQFADLATPHVDAAEAWRETLDYQKATADMVRVLQDAWGRAFQSYSKSYSLEDMQSGQVTEALDEWLKAANGELLETQRSTAFMDAQKRLLRAATEIKARQRELAESWSENYQMPTRTEVDDLSKIVHELRREVRKLKRELAAVKAG